MSELQNDNHFGRVGESRACMSASLKDNHAFNNTGLQVLKVS